MFVGGPTSPFANFPLGGIVVVTLAVGISTQLAAVFLGLIVLIYLYVGLLLMRAKVAATDRVVGYHALLGWQEVDVEIARQGQLDDVSAGMRLSRLILPGLPFRAQPLALLTRKEWRELLQSDGPNDGWTGDQTVVRLYRDIFRPDKRQDSASDDSD
jgi:hypothetical protein